MDIASTGTLMQLRAVPETARDEAWADRVFAALPKALLLYEDASGQIAPRPGPDLFNYLHLHFPPESGLKEGDVITPVSVLQLLDYCLESACGIAIHNDASCQGEPFWVLSYGNLESLRFYQNLGGDPYDIEEISVKGGSDNSGHLVSETVAVQRDVVIGAPSEEFLSTRTRQYLKMMFRENFGLENVGVAIVQDHEYAPSRHVCFSLNVGDLGSEENIEVFMSLVGWFLIPMRPIMFNPGFDVTEFVPL